ncbi:acetyl-coenzyme A carboxylase carboxyl transferase subunit alpha, chloroplastic-like [Apium graveolens]|uniref:acetyl-coenzyme A carboxylase carboxyl transferase subunit alpha, chloroplastic-like n=1 Tax=Apium graveolens TaxID=4045 RepID=UPI003D7B6252
MFIGQQKGRNTKENIMPNFGMPNPMGGIHHHGLSCRARYKHFKSVAFVGKGKARADDDDVDDGVGSERTESDDGNDRDMSVPYNVVSRGSLIIKG